MDDNYSSLSDEQLADHARSLIHNRLIKHGETKDGVFRHDSGMSIQIMYPDERVVTFWLSEGNVRHGW